MTTPNGRYLGSASRELAVIPRGTVAVPTPATRSAPPPATVVREVRVIERVHVVHTPAPAPAPPRDDTRWIAVALVIAAAAAMAAFAWMCTHPLVGWPVFAAAVILVGFKLLRGGGGSS